MLEGLKKKLLGRVIDLPIDDSEQDEPEEQFFELYKGDTKVNLVGLPNGATADAVESLKLVQVSGNMSDEDCRELALAFHEALPHHEAKKIIITKEADIKVFQWKKVEGKPNG